MSESGLSLLKRRTYFPLFLTQFLGAFNDNAFKLAMLTLISYHLTQSQSVSEHYQALAGALFTLPFFIFSATAGQLADKYDKTILIRIIKGFELLLMIIGGFGLYWGSTSLLMITLMGMGVHSTFFGPIKYAILPDQLERRVLLSATALIEASTFLAILLGTTLGTLSIGSIFSHTYLAIILTITAALMGFIASFFIPRTPSSDPLLIIDWHLWRATFAMLKEVTRNKQIVPAIFAISWFWMIGAIILTKLPDYIHYSLNANTLVFALFLSLFSIGIALGSVTVSGLLGGRITLRYVPHTMLLLSLFTYDLFYISPQGLEHSSLLSLVAFLSIFNNIRIALDFFLFSFCCGLFIVPLYTFLQVTCDETARARMIAANNIWNALFMVGGALLVMVLLYFNTTTAIVFLLLAILNGMATILLCIMLYRSPKLQHIPG